jgi:hypothetical protein
MQAIELQNMAEFDNKGGISTGKYSRAWNLEFEVCYRIAATTSYPETRVSAVYWVLASAISLSIWSAWV